MKAIQGSTVLLTHSNHVFYDAKQSQKMQPYPPLQTLLAAAVLRSAGFQVEVCDVTLENPEAKLTSTIERLAPCFVVVCEDDFNFLSKMCLSRNRDLAVWTARTAHEHGCLTVVHGSDSTDHFDNYLDAGFDYVLIGEVEETLRQLAAGREPKSITGLAYRCEGRTRRTIARPIQTNLDALPSPAWDSIDLEPYRNAWMRQHGYFSMNLVTSRGCPYRCNWCAKPTYGNNYHVRSPRAVAEEMRFIKKQYTPDHVWFADDIFALSSRWTRDFASVVEELDAVIPFKMQSRCDLMTRETVADLKRAGCVSVWMGAESGSQRILNAMEKGIRVEQIYQACQNLRSHDIRANWFLQFGYPGEDWEDIQSTIRMVRGTQPDDIGVSVSYPLPGTKFYQLVSSNLGAKTNWSESGDLTMTFRGAFSTNLYRSLASALHLEVRTPQDRAAITEAWAKVEELKGLETSAMEAAL